MPFLPPNQERQSLEGNKVGLKIMNLQYRVFIHYLLFYRQFMFMYSKIKVSKSGHL